ncbi:pilus assembly protein PilP [Moraxella atlantae]|uniref:pilus assembly protein PilP n=1 Tax=Faucicola atlantae TaxID=34059 RepID=UPI0037538682
MLNKSLQTAILVSGITVLSLTGCQDRVALAQQDMQDIRNQSAQPIQPPPEPEIVEAFNYSAQNLRSPFMPPSQMLQATQQEQIQGVRPDVTRLKEPLEQFELSELSYKGTMMSQTGQQVALIQRPDGSIATVGVGNYLGKNDGRIAEITPSQINIIEIVPDSRVGYVEKPNTLVVAAN